VSGPGADPRGGARAAAFVLELPSDLDVIESAVAYLVSRVRAFDFNGSRLNLNLRVGITEALANAMLYGNAGDPGKRVHVEVEIDAREVCVQVRDEGPGFDPDCIDDPTLPQNLERTGGRGIFLIRELMDEVRFNDCGNCIRLVLRREHPGPEARIR
jgi:serine/threonine-protein kinase RsbW